MKVLSDVVLGSGGHVDPDQGLCAMEAVAWLMDEAHSDHPQCVSPVIGSFIRSLNDRLVDEPRQRLKAYLYDVIGTNDGIAENEQKRMFLCADAAVREFIPAALEARGLIEQAAILRALPEIVDERTARGGQKAAYAAAAAAADAADAAADAADAAAYAADAAAYAAADAAYAAYAAADAAADAAAADAAYAAAVAVAGANFDSVSGFILRLCKIGK